MQQEWMIHMKRAIVTGATGAVGMALIAELIENNIEVLVLARRESKRNARIPEHKLVKVLFCDLSELSGLSNNTSVEYDVFFHLAWEGTFGAGRNDMYLQNLNVRYALDAVGAAKRFGCKRFIGIGSQAEYGVTNETLTPYTPTFPNMGYGSAKLCAGQMSRGYAQTLGISHIWVRILSVYGPYDRDDSMVMSTIDKLKKGIVPQFTEGVQMWDYLYSADAARALRLIAEKGVDKKVYVLGSGNARPLSYYIETIRSIAAPQGRILLGAIPYSEGQVMYLRADISELKADTGFEPAWEFEDGIRAIIADGFA
ncbi:MAG: NAD(P)-dependent oxidoreductase [Lachnoclostridium sp.]|nr:NAD(P)-dependent oxidoreductase [Lachnospira sp.]MCM1249050.1 NAD(P)-dependent oxidoreductase [Lachnoclostridium sp.]MCM1535876.1 NAD(P)-dependent oxidoreductase [Clostridium sp.]